MEIEIKLNQKIKNIDDDHIKIVNFCKKNNLFIKLDENLKQLENYYNNIIFYNVYYFMDEEIITDENLKRGDQEYLYLFVIESLIYELNQEYDKKLQERIFNYYNYDKKNDYYNICNDNYNNYDFIYIFNDEYIYYKLEFDYIPLITMIINNSFIMQYKNL